MLEEIAPSTTSMSVMPYNDKPSIDETYTAYSEDPAGTSRWLSGIDPFLGESARMQHLARAAARLLDLPSPLLIHGETGTGKGILARWLHHHGPRSRRPFIDVGCAGLDRTTLEHELFGYALDDGTVKPGLFEVAQGGTVFLDEIGDLDPEIQIQLAEVVERGLSQRSGESPGPPAAVWLLVSSNLDLEDLMTRCHPRFLEHLLTLEIPPLRDRPEDIPLLADSILRRLAAEMQSGGALTSARDGRPSLSAPAVQMLQGHSWRGNIRELKNVLERAFLLGAAPEIGTRDIQFDSLDSGRPREW